MTFWSLTIKIQWARFVSEMTYFGQYWLGWRLPLELTSLRWFWFVYFAPPVFCFLILNSPCCRTLPAEVGLCVALNVVHVGQIFLKVGKNVLPSGASYLNLPALKWSGISGSPPAARIWLYKSSVIPFSLLISCCKFTTKSFMPSQL